jgi:hypothetical protein
VKRQLENSVLSALVGWERVNNFPSIATFLILSLCLATACQRKPLSDEKRTDQANQSGQSNQDTQTDIDKGDLKLLYQARKTPNTEWINDPLRGKDP